METPSKRPKLENELSMNPVMKFGNSFRWKFEDIMTLGEEPRFSDSYFIDRYEWKLGVKVERHYLSVFLKYENDDKKWLCELDGEFRLLKQDGGGYENKSKFKTPVILTETERCRGIPSFKGWNEVIEYDYVQDNSLIIEAEFNFKIYHFSKQIPNFTDICIEVGDAEFYVSKGFLCSSSSYFYDLLIANDTKETRFKIDDVTPDEFCVFLASLYPITIDLTDENQSILFAIAEKFGVRSIHLKFEQYMITSNRFKLIEKVILAENQGYEYLMNHCLNSFRSAREIKVFSQSYEYKDLNDSTKLRLLGTLLKLC
ncbi:unnamed protein product [Caenorhabditis angaria]|uniref:BTB domain-containing protein n=1 Tax=Caenorhabditis angaria TaxID=860376 RepID=A0A9P1I4D6_9PELO|nr:unnamed protein product [Caenorhabditis angaria]